MELDTRDECLICHRLISWEAAPLILDENDEDKRPFWARKPQWVDVDPPGEDVWNPHCKWEERTGEHKPAHYCMEHLESGGICGAKVKKPQEGLVACGRHIKHVIARLHAEQHRAARMESKQWEDESQDGMVRELRKHGVRAFPQTGMGYVPYDVRQYGMVVLPKDVLTIIERLIIEKQLLIEMAAEHEETHAHASAG